MQNQSIKSNQNNSNKPTTEETVIPIENMSESTEPKPKTSNIRSLLIFGLMLFIAAVMTFDKYFSEAVMPLIEDEYGIDIKEVALIEGLFALGFALLAITPIFGYISDHLSQKIIMCIGMILWAVQALSCSFVPQQLFWLIPVLRGAVGAIADFFVGAALPLIGDRFPAANRRFAIILFRLSNMIFTLLAIGLAAFVANQYSWHEAIFIAPCLGAVCFMLLLAFMKDQPGDNTEDEAEEPQIGCSVFSHVKPLLSWSFALIMIGSLSVAFINEGLFALIPEFLDRTRNETENEWPLILSQSYYSDFMVYSLIKCAADILGMLIGVQISKLFSRTPHCADPWVCGVGLFIFAPFFYLFLIYIEDNLLLPCVFIFISGIFLSFNQAIAGDMMLSVLRPKYYTIAGQLQSFLTQLIAGVGAPFIVEFSSDKIQEFYPYMASDECLKFGLMILSIVAAIGGVCFLCSALTIERDRKAVEKSSTPSLPDV